MENRSTSFKNVKNVFFLGALLIFFSTFLSYFLVTQKLREDGIQTYSELVRSIDHLFTATTYLANISKENGGHPEKIKALELELEKVREILNMPTFQDMRRINP